MFKMVNTAMFTFSLIIKTLIFNSCATKTQTKKTFINTKQDVTSSSINLKKVINTTINTTEKDETSLVTEIPDHSNRNIFEPYDSTSSTKYIELLIVLDYQYLELEDEMKKQIREAFVTMNQVYRVLGIYIILVDIILLQEINMDIDPYDLEETLNNFHIYLRDHPTPTKDLSLLIVSTDDLPMRHIYDIRHGFTFRSTLCTYGNPALVVLHTISLRSQFGIHMIHEMGHAIGFEHDEAWCYCPADKCIMNPLISLMPSVKSWSRCTQLNFMVILLTKSHQCLENFPLVTTQLALCGNGLRELPEECDCGTKEICDTKCCVPHTCQLVKSAACATGKCCDLDSCRIKEAGVECRPSKSCCDLPEYCNGLDEMCPEDVYLNDGHSCNADGEESFCYQGECNTYKGQCNKIWGKNTNVSNIMCFQKGNIQGSFSGHCSFDIKNQNYTACRQEDAMCGTLYCESSREGPHEFGIKSFLILHYNKTQDGHACRSAIYKDAPRHSGLVRDGVKCGVNSICLNNACRKIDEVTKPLCKCHKTGICNSMGQCYHGAKAPKECIEVIHASSRSHKAIALGLVEMLLLIMI